MLLRSKTEILCCTFRIIRTLYIMSMSRKKCCVPGCLESKGSHGTLHQFPNPVIDGKRFNEWVLAIGGDILGLKNEDIYKLRKVCHAHFEEKFWCRCSRISKIAVPTLNLPGPLSLPKFTFDVRRPTRQIQNCALNSPPSSTPSTSMPLTGYQMDLPLLTLNENEALNKSTLKANMDPETIPPKVANKATKEIKTESHNKNAISRTRKKTTLTLREQKLYQKLRQAKIQIRKYCNIIKKNIASVKAANNIISNAAFLTKLERFSSTAKLVTIIQFEKIKKQSKG